MSHGRQRSPAREAKRRRQSTSRRVRSRDALNVLILGGFILAVLGLVVLWTWPGQHPEPREDAVAERVVPASDFSRHARVASRYRQAAEIPRVLDGIYCYCNCSRHSGHYSLLDCFESDHAAGCAVCLEEAAIAYRLTREGEPLDRIRTELDRRFRIWPG